MGAGFGRDWGCGTRLQFGWESAERLFSRSRPRDTYLQDGDLKGQSIVPSGSHVDLVFVLWGTVTSAVIRRRAVDRAGRLKARRNYSHHGGRREEEGAGAKFISGRAPFEASGPLGGDRNGRRRVEVMTDWVDRGSKVGRTRHSN